MAGASCDGPRWRKWPPLARPQGADRPWQQRRLCGWRGRHAFASRARGHMPGHQIEQRRRALGHGMAGNLSCRAFGGHAIDDGEAGVDGCAVVAVEGTRDRRGEHDAADALQLGEGLAVDGVAGREAVAGDGDEASARCKAKERRAQMTIIRSRAAALHMQRGGEWRVHQDDARARRRGQVVVNLLGVEAGDRYARKQESQEIGARRGDFIERQRSALKLGEDGELARAGGGFEHAIGGGDRRGDGRDETQLQRRRELLELLALLGAARVRRRERRELAEHVEEARVRSGAGAHAGEVAAQKKQLRHLARLVGVLPDPGAFIVVGAERIAHRLAQPARVERLPKLEGREQRGGRPHQARGRTVGAGFGFVGEKGKLGLGGVGDNSHGRHPWRLEERNARDGPLSRTPSRTLFSVPSSSSPPLAAEAGGSRAHHGAHADAQRVDIVEEPQGREVVGAARVIAAPLTGADQDAVVAAKRGLAHLDIDGVVVERDLAGDGDAALIGTEVVAVRRPLHGVGKRLELLAGRAVKGGLSWGVIGAGDGPLHGGLRV